MKIELTDLERDVVISLLGNAMNGWQTSRGASLQRYEAAQRVIDKLQTFCACPGSKHPGRTHCLICLRPYPTESSNPACPECGEDLREVEYPKDCPLNRDQWASQLAGDLFCTCHNNYKANKPYAYFWRSEFAGASGESASMVCGQKVGQTTCGFPAIHRVHIVKSSQGYHPFVSAGHGATEASRLLSVEKACDNFRPLNGARAVCQNCGFAASQHAKTFPVAK